MTTLFDDSLPVSPPARRFDAAALLEGLNPQQRAAVAHEGSPRDVLLAWFESYAALISLHKGGPAKITSAMGDRTSPIHTKCKILATAADRVVGRLDEEQALKAGIDAVQMCRLVGAVAAVADQGDLDAAAVRPMLEVIADGMLA